MLSLQGSSDPGGEQVGPGGAQQYGDHSAHHEPVLRHRDLRRGKGYQLRLPPPSLDPQQWCLERARAGLRAVGAPGLEPFSGLTFYTVHDFK